LTTGWCAGSYRRCSYEKLLLLATSSEQAEETYQLVDSVSGRLRVSQRIGRAVRTSQRRASSRRNGTATDTYPDTSTSLSWLRQVEDDLQRYRISWRKEEIRRSWLKD